MFGKKSGGDGNYMAKYRKKPIVVEAFILGETPTPAWWDEAIAANLATPFDNCAYAILKSSEGFIRVERGEYVIKGIMGELYPCKPDTFELLYEPVRDRYF